MGLEPTFAYYRYETATADLDSLVDRYLTAADEAYYTSLKAPGRKFEFVFGRAVSKQLLSETYGKPVDFWQIGRAESGRPVIENGGFESVDISISHSGGVVLIGLSQQGRVGVDVEQIKAQRDVVKLAKGFFHKNEVRVLLAAPPRDASQYFYTLWTLKEAYAKASGENLYSTLSQYDLSKMLMDGREGLWTDISDCVAGTYHAAFKKLENKIPFALITSAPVNEGNIGGGIHPILCTNLN